MSIGGAPPRARGRTASWTFLERYYDLRLDDARETLVIGGRWERLREARRLVIPLHDDLPPGEYLIDVEVEGGAGGYISLSRAIGGRSDAFRLSRE